MSNRDLFLNDPVITRLKRQYVRSTYIKSDDSPNTDALVSITTDIPLNKGNHRDYVLDTICLLMRRQNISFRISGQSSCKFVLTTENESVYVYREALEILERFRVRPSFIDACSDNFEKKLKNIG